MKNSIAIIGCGFVGGSLSIVFSERGMCVYAFDKAKNVCKSSDPFKHDYTRDYPKGIYPFIAYQRQKEVMLSSDNETTYTDFRFPLSVEELVEACEKEKTFSGVYFVCLPTPMREDGSCDLSIVEGVLTQLSKVPGERIAVVKSTVPPGSTERWNKMFEETGLRVVFNPEFLTEANALDDMRNQNRIVLGGPRPYINTVKRLFESAFSSVPIIKTNSTTAEMVKYMTNIHLAVKVLLANEFYQICETLDKSGLNIDYDKCVEYATLDIRLGKSHWKVPGPMPLDDGSNSPAMGVGGSCFVKDLNALISLAKSIGVKPTVMEGAWQKNLEVRPQKDWLKLVGRAISKKE